ncbi:MAG: hypothetical protein IPM29_31270 [Planctomycetes bacterium]|nr:hypothetical protein [Planctomycetota bacterium]
MITVRALVGALALACIASAQLPVSVATTTKSSGPLVGVTHALSVDGATCGLSRAENWIRVAGFPASPPAPLPIAPTAGGGALPDYRIASIVGAATAAVIDIDAISIGFDLIHSNTSGVMIPPPPPATYLLSFSVTRGTVGVAGPIRAESSATDGNAADLFSYTVRGPGPIDRVDLAQDSTEIRLECGRIGDMDAHDLYIPLYYGAPFMLQMLSHVPAEYYFSVTSATAPLCPTAWWAGTRPSGATVLWTSWTGTAWTPIRPFVTYSQLGLQETAELDALAVAPRFLPVRWMLYSTGDGRPDPIMIYGVTPALGPFVYTVMAAGGPVPVSRRIGLGTGGTDDVDAICSIDPGFAGPPPIWHIGPGGPVPGVLPAPLVTTSGMLTIGESRTSTGFLLELVGCPPAGCLAPSIDLFLLAFAGTTSWIITTPLSLPLGANVLEVQLAFPQPALYGIDLDAYWLRTNPGLSFFDASDPVRVHF